nr:NigD-like protein [Dysgonomonas sp. 521]
MQILCFVLAIGFTSCSDDGYSLDKYWRSMVTVNKVGENTYDFTLDSGEKLWVAAPVGINLKPKYDRAIINYTILSDKFDGYDHAVKLNGFTDVLTKEIAYIAPDDEVQQDSIGYDPIKVYSIWASGGYMNIYFSFNTGETKAHLINMVSARPDLSTLDDVVKLEFRHNRNGDPEHYGVNGYVSFDLTPYLTSGRDKVTFDIEWTDFSGDTKIKTIEYKYGEAGTAGSTALNEKDNSTNLNIY